MPWFKIHIPYLCQELFIKANTANDACERAANDFEKSISVHNETYDDYGFLRSDITAERLKQENDMATWEGRGNSNTTIIELQ